MSPVSPVYSVESVIEILRSAAISFGLTLDGRLWFEPVENLPAGVDRAAFGAAVRENRAEIEWLIKHRRPGWPASEIWLSSIDWDTWRDLRRSGRFHSVYIVRCRECGAKLAAKSPWDSEPKFLQQAESAGWLVSSVKCVCPACLPHMG